MAVLVGDPFELLLQATAKSTQQQVLFDRDQTDSYQIRLQAVRSDRRQLTRAEVMPALPVGSRWADAVGWESYVVFPALSQPDRVVLIGLEHVVPHRSREAYPVFAGAVLPLADVPAALRAIAAGLDSENTDDIAATYGVVSSSARSIDEHRKTAAWILRAASSAFAADKQLLVRTAILTQDEVPPGRTLRSPRSILLGAVSPLRSHFSWKAKLILKGLEAVIPDRP
jgi:hypothetical protein